MRQRDVHSIDILLEEEEHAVHKMTTFHPGVVSQCAIKGWKHGKRGGKDCRTDPSSAKVIAKYSNLAFVLRSQKRKKTIQSMPRREA